jgi:hypothetical protein
MPPLLPVRPPIQGSAILISSDDEIPPSIPSGLEIRSNPLSSKGYVAQGAKEMLNLKMRQKYQAKGKPSVAAPPLTKQQQKPGGRGSIYDIYIGVALIVIDFYFLSEDDRKWGHSKTIKRDTAESKFLILTNYILITNNI